MKEFFKFPDCFTNLLMKKFIFFSMVFLLLSCTDSVEVETFKCDSYIAAIECENCKPYKNLPKRVFKVNVERQQVLSNGTLLNNCKVFDKKNWSCVESDFICYSDDRMRNGQYSNIRDCRRNGGSALYSCGK